MLNVPLRPPRRTSAAFAHPAGIAAIHIDRRFASKGQTGSWLNRQDKTTLTCPDGRWSIKMTTAGSTATSAGRAACGNPLPLRCPRRITDRIWPATWKAFPLSVFIVGQNPRACYHWVDASEPNPAKGTRHAVESRGACASQGPPCGHPPAEQRTGDLLIGRTLPSRSEEGPTANLVGIRSNVQGSAPPKT